MQFLTLNQSPKKFLQYLHQHPLAEIQPHSTKRHSPIRSSSLLSQIKKRKEKKKKKKDEESMTSTSMNDPSKEYF
jgi:hypothetical protein